MTLLAMSCSTSSIPRTVMLICAVLIGIAARTASAKSSMLAAKGDGGDEDISREHYHTAKAGLHKQMSRVHFKHALVSTPKHAAQAVVGATVVEPARATRAMFSGKPKQAGEHLKNVIRRPRETAATSLSAGMYSLQRGACHRTQAKKHARKAAEARGTVDDDDAVGRRSKSALAQRLQDIEKSVAFDKKYFDKHHDEIGAYAIGSKDEPADPNKLRLRKR